VPVNDRIITATFHTPITPLTVIQVYDPTDCTKDPTAKDAFYEQLQQQLDQVPEAHMLLLMGDFNAKLGNEAWLWGGTIGRICLPAPVSDNGKRLYMAHNLAVSDTMFQHKDVHLQTWYNPNPHDSSKHQIDHIIVKRRDIKAVRDTRVYRGADVESDHRLMISKLQLKLRKPAKHTMRPQLQPASLHSNEGKAAFQLSLQNLLSTHHQIPILDVEQAWLALRSPLNDTAQDLLRQSSKPQKSWISEATVQLAEQKRRHGRPC